MSTLSRRDRLIPWYFVAFFLVVFAVDITMATLAVRTHPGTVEDHPYERGIGYNKTIAAEENQEKLGWKADITLSGRDVSVVLRDASGKPIATKDMVVQCYRPSQQSMDRAVPFTQGKASLAALAPGLWELRVFITAQGKSFQQSKRVVLS